MIESEVRKLIREYLIKSGWFVFHVHQQGYWEKMANGTLSLVNIRVSDVRRIELSPR